jgi:hypothetical protein
MQVFGYSELGATMNNETNQRRGLERITKANIAREASEQRIASNSSGLLPIDRTKEPKQVVQADARLQCFGSKYTAAQIAQIYTQPEPQQ